jgi:hypothetical protein
MQRRLVKSYLFQKEDFEQILVPPIIIKWRHLGERPRTVGRHTIIVIIILITSVRVPVWLIRQSANNSLPYSFCSTHLTASAG